MHSLQNTGDTHFIYHQQEMGAFVQDQIQGQQPLRDHARHSLRLAKLSGHAQAGLFTARLVCVGARSRLENHRARRRRHLLRPLRRRPAARSGALQQRAPSRNHSCARSRHAAGHGLRAHHQLRHAHRAAAHAGRVGCPTPKFPTRFTMGSPSSASSASAPRERSAPTPCAESTCSAPSTSTRLRRSPATRCAPIPRTAASARCSPKVFTSATVSIFPTAACGTSTLPALAATPGRITSRTPAASAGFPKISSTPGRSGRIQATTAASASACTPSSTRRACSTWLAASLRIPARPGPIVTGTDPYGDGLFNARPDGVGRNSETGPGYVDLDLRWGHDFAITANKDDEAPHLGFSASSFNVVNHRQRAGNRHRRIVNLFQPDHISRAAPPHAVGHALFVLDL